MFQISRLLAHEYILQLVLKLCENHDLNSAPMPCREGKAIYNQLLIIEIQQFILKKEIATLLT